MKHIGFLAVLFVVLLGAVIVKETSRPDAGSLRDQLPQQSLAAQPYEIADVAKITVEGPDGAAPFSLLRGAASWTVEEPFRAPAATGVVDTFLAAVHEARGELRLDDTAALAKFDLSDSRAVRITFEDASGATLVQFALGKSSGQRGAFVRPLTDGVRDGAYAVSQDLRSAIGLPRTRPGGTQPSAPEAAHFHDKSLAPLAREGSTRLELETPHWKLAFEKRGPAWAAAEGAPNAPMRGKALDQLVRQFGGTNAATALVDPARADELGFGAPTYRAKFVDGEGGERQAFGVVDGGKYYMRFDTDVEPNVVYELSRYAFERLFPKGATLFELASLDAEDVTSVTVKRSGGHVTMSRPGPNDDWTLTAPAWGLPVDATQLRSLGASLRGVRAIDWYAGSLDFAEAFSVTYTTPASDPESPRVLRVGQDVPGGDGVLAKFPGSDAVVVLATSAVDRLRPELLSLFQTRPLAGITSADIESVAVRTIAAADGTKTDVFDVIRGDDAWTVDVGGAASPGADVPIELWLTALLDTEVTGRSDYLGPCSHEIEVRAKGKEPVVLQIGGSSELGTALVLGETGFFASVPESATDFDPTALIRAESPTPPAEDGDNRDSE